ncbi:hypothetical protein ECB98_13410 [Brucellaceae bacterium VT-16-1752]|nr:hypothetical protein ECB98_13410 [Brucellaceae bacterium VT-16-1752]
MQLDAASRNIRTARAARFAECDKSVPFRKPLHSSRGTVTDLDDGVLRGKRLSWSQFYKLLPEEEEHRPTVMIEIAPGCYVNEALAAKMGRTTANARSYQTSVMPRAAIRQRSITVSHAVNDNRPTRQTARSVPDKAAQRAQVDASLKATADAIAAHAVRMASRATSTGQLSTPDRIARALEKHDLDIGKAFYRLRELMRPPLIAANDNLADPDVEEKDRAWGMERKHNQSSMTPSIPKMLRAYERGQKIGVQYHNRHSSGKPYTWIGGRVRGKFTGLFIGHGEGAPMFYQDDDGRRQKAKYRDGILTDRELDHDQEVEDHALQMAGLASYMALNRGPVMRGVLEERYVISGERPRRHSVYSTGVASYKPSDYGRLCISDMKGVGEGKTTAPAMAEMAEIDRANTAADFFIGLPATDKLVVETMLVADSFSEVAAAVGKEPTSHNGKRLVLTALEKYSEKIAA